jgi:enoyl-CoA hydratase/carnithine racemase
VDELCYEVRGHVATITVNRPHRRNAFTLAMVDAWADAVREAESDRAVRVVILTGAGESFCAGVDLDEFKYLQRTPLEERELLTHRVHRVAHAMEALSKPAIAAVNGVAVGAGMDMALMCDVRLASESARFSEGYIRVGLVPGDGGCYYLPRLIGREHALRMLWTGDFIDAPRALSLGLVSEIHPQTRIQAAATALAEKIAARAPLAVQMIKRAVNGAFSTDARTALDAIASHQAVVLSTRDSAEAFAAFKEGRDPHFEGR